MDDGIRQMTVLEYLECARRRLLNAAAMAAAYESWENGFSRSEIRNAWNDAGYRPWGRRVALSEIDSLSDDDLRGLGFAHWDGDHWLIPLWAWGYVRDGERVVSISGDAKTKGQDDIDLDVRAGCIAWGWKRATPATVAE